MELLEGAVARAAASLIAIQPLDASSSHFFLSPERHVVEGTLMSLFFLGLMQSSKWAPRNHAKHHTETAPPLNIIERILGFTLMVNFIAQLIYKTARGWRVLSYMLQPCHMVTLLLLYCLYSSNYKRAVTVFQISQHYTFFTILAIAVPDLSQLHLPLEVLNFWVQHYALLITPMYLLFFSNRFPLTPSLSTSLLAIGLGGLFHFIAQVPAGMVTGVNVNYMLWPPPGVPTVFAGQNYRQLMATTFIFLALLTGYFLPKIALLLQKPNKNQSKTKAG